MGFSVKKLGKSLTKPFKSVTKSIEKGFKGVMENELTSLVVGGPAGYMIGQQMKANDMAKEAKREAEREQAAYAQQVADAEARAREENRAQLFSLKRNYNKKLTPTVSSGAGGAFVGSDEQTSIGSIKLG